MLALNSTPQIGVAGRATDFWAASRTPRPRETWSVARRAGRRRRSPADLRRTAATTSTFACQLRHRSGQSGLTWARVRGVPVSRRMWSAFEYRTSAMAHALIRNGICMVTWLYMTLCSAPVKRERRKEKSLKSGLCAESLFRQH